MFEYRPSKELFHNLWLQKQGQIGACDPVNHDGPLTGRYPKGKRRQEPTPTDTGDSDSDDEPLAKRQKTAPTAEQQGPISPSSTIVVADGTTPSRPAPRQAEKKKKRPWVFGSKEHLKEFAKVEAKAEEIRARWKKEAEEKAAREAEEKAAPKKVAPRKVVPKKVVPKKVVPKKVAPREEAPKKGSTYLRQGWKEGGEAEEEESEEE